MKKYILGLFCLLQMTAFAQVDSNSQQLEKTPPARSVKEAAVSYDQAPEETTASPTSIPAAPQKTLPVKKGHLSVDKDQNIDLLIQDYVDSKKFNGYRIQLFAGNSKPEALKVKSDFLTKYEDNYPEVIYQVPNFKVRVGNYRDRLEATKMLQTYKTDFPYAFIVQDEIELGK